MTKKKTLIIIISGIFLIGIILGMVFILLHPNKQIIKPSYIAYTLEELEDKGDAIVKGKIIGNPDPKFKSSNEQDNFYYQTYNFKVDEVIKGEDVKNTIKVCDYADEENISNEGRANFVKDTEYILVLYKNDEVKNKKSKTEYYSLVYEINGVFVKQPDNSYKNIAGYTIES